MACIAGTVERPRQWVRFAAGEPVEMDGRWCDRKEPFTARAQCSSCPAYRGVRYDTSLATGVAPSGDPVGLTMSEYVDWRDAQEEALIDDDFSLIAAWQDRMLAGIGQRALRDIGDPDATDAWNKYMRTYRARNPDYAERNREQTRARMRARRAVCKQRQSPPTGDTC